MTHSQSRAGSQAGDDSEGIARPRLVICGAGALGGNLIEHLARSATAATLVVVDHDRVEAGNVGNQPFDLRQCGRTKVHALAARVYEACGCTIEGIHATLDAHSALRLLRGANLVVDALDNVTGRHAVRDACMALGVPVLHAGLGPDGYVDVRGNTSYRVGAPAHGPARCRDVTSREQVLLAVSLAAHAIRRALAGEPMANIANRALQLGAVWDSALTT